MDIITILVILVFVSEIIIQLIDDVNFYKTLSFILDLIGVISLAISLSFVNGQIVNGKSFPIYGLLSFGYRVIYII
jgi:hypothetical protein